MIDNNVTKGRPKSKILRNIERAHITINKMVHFSPIDLPRSREIRLFSIFYLLAFTKFSFPLLQNPFTNSAKRTVAIMPSQFVIKFD